MRLTTDLDTRVESSAAAPCEAAPCNIAFLVCNMQEFGGLEEIAVELATALHRRGDAVTVYSTDWTPQNNRYRRRLELENVPFVQPPKRLSLLASDWATKENALRWLTRLAGPAVLVLAVAVWAARRGRWSESWKSAHGWLRGRISRHTSVNRRPLVTRTMLRRAWSKQQPDIVHIHGYGDNLLFAIDWVAAQGIPVVYEEHSTPDRKLDMWRESESSINKSARILACSEASAQGLRDVCGARRPIVARPPLCADPWPQGWTAPASDDHRELQITTMARLYVAKGLSYLLEAIAIVQKHYPRVVFRVYGDGNLRSQLLQDASRLGLKGEDIFVGAFGRSELKAVMERTDIWVSSSILEGQSVALVEAMAYGRAIVTTDAGGSAELIRHGVNGMLCPQGDPAALAQNILTLIGSPALRRRLGAAARRSYESGGHQPKELASLVSSVYREVLSEGAPNRVPGHILRSR